MSPRFEFGSDADRDVFTMRRVTLWTLLAWTLVASGCHTTAVARRAEPKSSSVPAVSKSADRVEGVARRGSSTSSAAFADVDTSTDAIRQVSDQYETPISVESPSSGVQAPAFSAFSVRQAVETSLMQNPDLVALRQTEGVSAAALGVAETDRKSTRLNSSHG